MTSRGGPSGARYPSRATEVHLNRVRRRSRNAISTRIGPAAQRYSTSSRGFASRLRGLPPTRHEYRHGSESDDTEASMTDDTSGLRERLAKQGEETLGKLAQ